MNRLHHKPNNSQTITPSSEQSDSERTASTEVGSLVRHAQLTPSQLKPHDILRLQRTIGNQATGQLIQPRNHPIPLAISSRSPSGVGRKLFRTKWEADGESGIEKSPIVGNYQWYRKELSPEVYVYKFIIEGFTTLGEEYENQWKTRAEWKETPYSPPPDVETETKVFSQLPQDEEGGWQVRTFIELMLSKGIAGVCNALSAAWLTQLIAPTEWGKSGVNSTNVENVMRLKSFLDGVVMFFHRVDSASITLGFVDYFKEKGLDSEWFESFKSEHFVDQQQSEFIEYMKSWLHRTEEHTKQGYIEDSYSNLTKEVLYEMVDTQVLEPLYNHDVPFQGIISFKAKKQKINKLKHVAGHEWSIRYTPQGHIFEIYDQNGGLLQKEVSDQEEISETLVEYIWKNYINNPIPNSDYAQIGLTIVNKGL